MKTKQIIIGLIAMLLVGAGVLSGCIKEAVVTPSVDWNVTCEPGSNDDVVNDQARTITIFCDVNKTTQKMYQLGTLIDLTHTDLYFEIAPQKQSGSVVNISQGYVTECGVINPGAFSIYASAGSDISLVTKNNQNLYNFIWNYGGNDKFEKITVTSTSFFPTEVDLTIVWNALGVSLIGAGESKTVNLNVAGEFWTIFLNVNNVWT